MDDRQLQVIRDIGKFDKPRKFEEFYKVGSRNGIPVYIREFSARKLSDDALRSVVISHRTGLQHKITERDRRIARLMLSVPRVSWVSVLIGYVLFAASISLIVYISCGPYRLMR